MSMEAGASSSAVCVDACCPSIVIDEQGEKSFYIPPASIVTTLGGLCLIAVHAGNLCSCCSTCRRKKKLCPVDV